MGEDIDFGDDPEPVIVPSANGRTILIGYLWRAKARVDALSRISSFFQTHIT